MAAESAIDWLKRGDVHGATWNPWLGCAHATYLGSDGRAHQHPGCQNCYAEAWANRFKKCRWGLAGTRVKTTDQYWRKLSTWNEEAAAAGVLLPVFPSLCDPFEDWTGPISNASGIPLGRCATCHGKGSATGERMLAICQRCGESDTLRRLTMEDVRREFFSQIAQCRNLEAILVTKRPGNIRRFWPNVYHRGAAMAGKQRMEHVSLYYSASDQDTFDYGAPIVAECAGLCGLIGISAEPFLGPIEFKRCESIGHVIIGVESNGTAVGRLGAFGDEAAWHRGAASLVAQCRMAGVPAYVKQVPINGRVSHDPDEWPNSLRVRDFADARSA